MAKAKIEHALKINNFEEIKNLLKSSVAELDPMTLDTILDAAVKAKETDVVKILSSLNSDNKPSQSAVDYALIQATSHGKSELIKLLATIKGDNKPSQSGILRALQTARDIQDFKIIYFGTTTPNQYILDQIILGYVDIKDRVINWEILRALCLLNNNPPSVDLINKALVVAAKQGQYDLVVEICKHMNASDLYPITTGELLKIAVEYSRMDVIRAIFEKKFPDEDMNPSMKLIEQIINDIFSEKPVEPVVEVESDLTDVEEQLLPQTQDTWDVSFDVVGGFIAILGVAAIAIAFTVLGPAGCILATLGVGLALAGMGLFAYDPTSDYVSDNNFNNLNDCVSLIF